MINLFQFLKLQMEKKKLGAIDERFMKEGEALLFGELAAALDILPNEVPQYIQKRLGEEEKHLVVLRFI